MKKLKKNSIREETKTRGWTMEINRRKLKLMIRACENEVSNEKLQPAPKKEDIQF